MQNRRNERAKPFARMRTLVSQGGSFVHFICPLFDFVMYADRMYDVMDMDGDVHNNYH